FRRANDAWKSGSGSSIQLLFPNVELRLSHATRRDSAINIHLMCAPDQVDELDRFLSALEFRYDGRQYRCDTDDLTRLGRAYSANDKLEDHSAFREGARQFKVDFESLRRTYENDVWAKQNLLVAVAGSGTDGTAGLQTPDD